MNASESDRILEVCWGGHLRLAIQKMLVYCDGRVSLYFGRYLRFVVCSLPKDSLQGWECNF